MDGGLEKNYQSSFKEYNIKFKIGDFDDLISYLVISIIIGGRLGYVIFYNFEYYISSPLDIIKVWEGGMSFHGALVGIIISTFLFAKKCFYIFYIRHNSLCCTYWNFLGRAANFINGELIGKVTNVSWSVIFPLVDMLQDTLLNYMRQSWKVLYYF